MKFKIDDSILELLKPVTRDEENLNDVINMMVLSGIGKTIDDGFKGIDKDVFEKIHSEYIIKCLIKDLTGILTDD